MRVLGQCRSPGVEHGSEPDAGAEVLGVGRNRDQGLGGGFEQQVINDRLVLIGDVRDRSGQREDDMKIGHGQEFGLAVGQPFLGSGSLALRAVPVAAGVVRDAQVGAGFAAFDMTAQCRRSAALDRRHHLQLAEAHMAGVGGTPSRPVMTEDVRHLDRRPRQRPRLAGHLQQEIEWARHLADRADGDAGVKRRRVEHLLSEQNLDDPDIGLLLQ